MSQMRREVSGHRNSDEQSSAVVRRIYTGIVEDIVKLAIGSPPYSELLCMSFSNRQSAGNGNSPMLFFHDLICIIVPSTTCRDSKFKNSAFFMG